MSSTKTIQVFEWSSLKVGESFQGVTFTQKHLDALGKYELSSPNTSYFKTLINQVRFNQYVGVIKVGELTIEVLPKTDKHELSKSQWQDILLQMLFRALSLDLKTTTQADISIRQKHVLDSYIFLFLQEVEKLIHQGLVKKYRKNRSNQTSLKGKLLVGKQVTRNATHAERFYVEHTVYDQDNIFNFLLQATLECILQIGTLEALKEAQSLLLFFPECVNRPVTQRTFESLVYDRKTKDYERAIELARIILLNYHPDIKAGKNTILAIMFDMNYLWESFIYYALRKAGAKKGIKVTAKRRKPFWRPEKGYTVSIVPDILVEFKGENYIIDTKWKYKSRPSVEDLRQLFAYGQYFDAPQTFLLYPDNQIEKKVRVKSGVFKEPESNIYQEGDFQCGLLFVDPIEDGKLNENIGEEILSKLKMGLR